MRGDAALERMFFGTAGEVLAMTHSIGATRQEGAHAEAGGGQDGSVLDAQVYENLVKHMGRDTMVILLGKLTRQLADLVAAGATSQPDRKLLAESAHAMVSAAGLLGFHHLSRSCRHLEQACLAERELGNAVGEVLQAREQALAAIAALQVAA
jgi:HPt (histidine-containing phosphotransfer) domain-containing protein